MPFSFLPQTPHLFLGRVHGRLVVFLKDNQNNESDMDLEEVMAQKKKNLEMLIRNKDEAIRKEMLQYEEAELYIVRSLRWLKRKLRLGLARTQPPVN